MTDLPAWLPLTLLIGNIVAVWAEALKSRRWRQAIALTVALLPMTIFYTFAQFSLVDQTWRLVFGRWSVSTTFAVLLGINAALVVKTWRR